MAQKKVIKALLFDIGGVCVVSPFQAILDYEISEGIPPGWVNFSISRSSPNGSWHQLERGEIKMDAAFFAGFYRDLHDSKLWKEYWTRSQAKSLDPSVGKEATATSTAAGANAPAPIPSLPEIDAEWLFWEMMRVSRTTDQYMFPALQKLKASGCFVMAALSNTVIYPPDHPYGKGTFEDVRRQFDVFVSSAHVGLRKPDPRIYELAIREIDSFARGKGLGEVKADEVVFLDDIGENLKAGKKAGLNTIKVHLGKTDDAVKELERITGLALLEDKDTKARL
ncbi:MAG: hypothetical protein M1827_004395 [Pycnora praestabilis]|nr:MAG: hypothetical protein M1827_004395 [Pycnora praestabilis]